MSDYLRMKNPIIQLLAGNYLKKNPRMGNFVKERYGDKVYTIGFTSYQGRFGLDRKKKIRPARKGTLEFLLSQSEYDNFLVPLKQGSFKNYKSRPLGNKYIKNDVGDLMDAIIFNRNMNPSKTDVNFFLKIYPENKHLKPVKEE